MIFKLKFQKQTSFVDEIEPGVQEILKERKKKKKNASPIRIFIVINDFL